MARFKSGIGRRAAPILSAFACWALLTPAQAASNAAGPTPLPTGQMLTPLAAPGAVF